MTKQIFIHFILFLSITSAYSQEASPPLAKRQPREIETEKATAADVSSKNGDKTTTQPLLFVEDKADTPKNNNPSQKANDENGNHQSTVSNNDPIVWYTLLMMLFTGGLLICNVLLCFATIKSANAAKAAADAAQKSVDTIPTIERAYIYISSVSADFESWRHVKGNQRSPIKITAHNYGKTPAKLTEIAIKIKIGTSNGNRIYWEEPDTDEIRDAVGRFIANSSEEVFKYYTHCPFGDGIYHINFSGEAKYVDIFGKGHIAYFDWTLISKIKRGFYINNPEHNYTT